DVAIVPEVGPEVIAGSTRMKAGTAQKLVLNMLSTAAMVRLGRVFSNLMINVQLNNDKLRKRARDILVKTTGASPAAAARALERSGKSEVVARQKFPKLAEWLQGRSQPTLHQLEALAKATSTPLGYFFLPKPPEERLPIPYFRTRADEPLRRPSPNLLETVQ